MKNDHTRKLTSHKHEQRESSAPKVFVKNLYSPSKWGLSSVETQLSMQKDTADCNARQQAFIDNLMSLRHCQSGFN